MQESTISDISEQVLCFGKKTKAKNAAASEWVVKQKLSLEDYCSNCFSYIHENPVAAGLVKGAAEWRYSSYTDYAGNRNGTLCNKALASKYCGYDERNFVNLKTSTDDSFLDEFSAGE